jgi:hypothetical protein
MDINFESAIRLYSTFLVQIVPSVIISEADAAQLRKEMIVAKMIPNTKDSFAFQIHGLRVIRTPDIRQGMFAITGE